MEDKILVIIESPFGRNFPLNVARSITIYQLKMEIIKKLNYSSKMIDRIDLIYNGNSLAKNFESLLYYNFHDGITIIIRILNDVLGSGCKTFEINIKFLKSPNSSLSSKKKSLKTSELFSILKLCLLKEIAYVMDESDIKKIISKTVMDIMYILKNGLLEKNNNIKENIKKILEKLSGNNIYTFAKYIEEEISNNDIENLKDLLPYSNKNKITNIQNYLSRYVKYFKIFEKQLDSSNKNSIFEYTIISLVIIERKNLDDFENERNNCPNKKDLVLFHGTDINSISEILTDMFKPANRAIFGKGVYFTDSLDYVWYYGSGKRIGDKPNFNRIPKLDEKFNFIASAVFYDKDHFKRVCDDEYSPKKNEINHALAESEYGHPIREIQPDETKFYGKEYVKIADENQILPMLSVTMKRVEYCVIWRDNNFSKNPVYNNSFDAIFKKFLKERLQYIQKMSKYNIYPCETTDEAINLIKRKKYSKIILISNVGTDLGGKDFVTKARNIIGSDVITLFLAYKETHLKWIKNFKNAIFSNEPKYYEEYIDSFIDGDEFKTMKNLKYLKEKNEEFYGVNYNFDENYLYYPNFQDGGKGFNKLNF